MTSPVFTSPVAVSVIENATTVMTVTATDADGDMLSYALTGGADQALFDIDSTSGVLTFIAPPDFETPGDDGANNIYDIEVSVDDGNSGPVTQVIAVTVGNVNEAPVFTNLDGDIVTFTTGQGAVTLDAAGTGGNNHGLTPLAVGLSDSDSADFEGGILTASVTGNKVGAEDLLRLPTTGAVSLTGTSAGSDVLVGGVIVGTLVNGIAVGNDLAMNLNANANAARVQTLVQALQYENINPATPSTDLRTIGVSLTDGDGGTSSTANISINIQTPAPGTFFNSGQTLGVASSFAVSLGDVDGDGDLDMVVANSPQFPQTGLTNGDPANTVWLNDGKGNFTDSGQRLGSSDSQAVSLGDLDGDGDLDMVVANWDNASTIWLNNGSGVFTYSGLTPAFLQSLGVSLGDVDADGDLDFVETNILGDNRVWLNDGTGTFTQSFVAVQIANLNASLGDLDGDGDLDIVWARGDRGNTIWLNDGKGSFTDSGQLLGDQPSEAVSLGDVDGDGDLDMVVANTWDFNAGFVGRPNTLWLNDGTGTFTDSGQLLGTAYSYDISLDDVDGDGDLDMIVANTPLFPQATPIAGDPVNTVWLNDGNGAFTDSGQALGTAYSNAVSLGDVDGDGDLDTVVANSGANTIWLNNGKPVFTSPMSVSVPEDTTAVWTVSASDVDGDRLTYTLTGGADQALFDIDNTGVLTFIAPPDFEAPGDDDANNIYDIEVSVDDGISGPVTQVIAVTVTPPGNSVDDDGDGGTTTPLIPLDPLDPLVPGFSISLGSSSTVTGTQNLSDGTDGSLLAGYIAAVHAGVQSANSGTNGFDVAGAVRPGYEELGLPVRTIVLTAPVGATAATIGTISINGDNVSELLVIDASGLPEGTVITLNNALAVLISGPVVLTGGLGETTLFADDGAQVATLGPGDDVLFGGADNDTIASLGGFDVLSGETGDDTVSGGDDTDRLLGTAGSDTLNGEAGDDHFFLTGGSHTVDGGVGSDTLVLNGTHAAATVTVAANGNVSISGQNTSGASFSATAESIETIVFSDAVLNFETGADDAAGQVLRLYQGLFGRAPDDAGAGLHIDLLQHGTTTLGAIAEAFLRSAEFETRFGTLDSQTDGDFVALLYQNILGRAPDDAGLAHSLALLASGKPRADLTLAFTQSTEFTDTTSSLAAQGVLASRAPIVTGTSANETFQGSYFNDTINGGDGIDTFSLTALRSEITVTSNADGSLTLTDTLGLIGTDQLTGIERIEFLDGTLAFSPTDTPAQVNMLTQLVLNRDATPADLGTAVGTLDTGAGSLVAIATQLLTDPEFADQSTALDNSALVSLFYTNGLERTPDDTGLTQWTAELDAGLAPADLAVILATSAEAVGLGPTIPDDGLFFS